MEQGGSKDDADAVAAARAKLEHEATTKDLKVETKRAMEIAGQPEPHDVCSPAAIFDHVHQAVLEVPELHAIATAIIGGTTAPAWSLDQGLLFFDGCFYLLLASPLLPDQLETLLVVG
jgi:hypothetical protein